MTRKRPLIDGWVCPNCGQNGVRHGRGGARACDAVHQGPVCPGLICKCMDGQCFSSVLGYGWRRSPCTNAFCQHCGWKGTLRSKDFEREFGDGRCPKSVSGFHVAAVRVAGDRNRTEHCMLQFDCKFCGAKGILMIDPIRDIGWKQPERKAPPSVVEEATPGGSHVVDPAAPGGVDEQVHPPKDVVQASIGDKSSSLIDR